MVSFDGALDSGFRRLLGLDRTAIKGRSMRLRSLVAGRGDCGFLLFDVWVPRVLMDGARRFWGRGCVRGEAGGMNMVIAFIPAAVAGDGKLLDKWDRVALVRGQAGDRTCDVCWGRPCT